MSTTLSPIVLEACSAASFSQYSFVATIVSILIGVCGLAALQRLAYSTKWLERSPCRQWKTISVTPADAGAAGAAAAATVVGGIVAPAPPVLAAAVASLWAGGGAQAAARAPRP